MTATAIKVIRSLKKTHVLTRILLKSLVTVCKFNCWRRLLEVLKNVFILTNQLIHLLTNLRQADTNRLKTDICYLTYSIQQTLETESGDPSELFHGFLEISMPIYDHTEASRRSIYIFATIGQYIRQSKIQFYKNVKRTKCHILSIENELTFNDKLPT